MMLLVVSGTGRAGRAARQPGCRLCAVKIEGLGKPGPEGFDSTGLIGEDFLATYLGEGVVLQNQVLILGGYSSVADEHDGVLLDVYFVKMTIPIAYSVPVLYQKSVISGISKT